jgi:dienelactone hydrolase
MTRAFANLLCGALLMLAFGLESARAQLSAGPQGPEEGVIRRQTWLVPAQDRVTLMWTSVFRPPGPGPFPLAVIAHGTTVNEMQRAAYPLPEYPVITAWLIGQGYAVAVPQRPGHGRTGGTYYEDQGGCENAVYGAAGFNTGAAIAAAYEYLAEQPFILKNGGIVIGHSAGGWGALALASQNGVRLKSVIAFAPGRGGRVDGVAGKNCAPDRLIRASRQIAAATRIPSLWFYAANDSYFPPPLARQLAEAYQTSGGRAEVHMLPAVGAEGHNLINAPEGERLWGPLLEKFLKK